MGWFKVKENIKRVKPLKVEYRIHVGEILFVDVAPEWVIGRHERVLGAVDDVYRRIQAEELWNAKCVRLGFDLDRTDYTKACLFRRAYADLESVSDNDIHVLRAPSQEELWIPREEDQ